MERRFRLKRASDFSQVRRKGRSYPTPELILVIHPNQLDHVRIGVAAGKYLGGAVKRNRAKRVLRAAIAPLIPQIRPGHDILLIARKPILSKKSLAVLEILQEKLKKAGLVK